jgi:hypothetical protein
LFKQSLFCGFILKEAQKKKGGSKIVKDGSQKIRGGNPTLPSPERGGENATKTNGSVITNSFNSIPSLKKEGGIRRRLFK